MDDRLFGLIKHGTTIRQLQLVLDSGLDINSLNERQETPLMACLIQVHDAKRREQTVRVLLLYGANVNSRNLRGQTPFMYSCILNQLDTLNIFLADPKVDWNLQDFEGNSSLMYACALGNNASIRLLLDAHKQSSIHIDPYLVNNEGATALDFARDGKNAEIVELIQSVMLDQSNDDDVKGDTDIQIFGTSNTGLIKKQKGKSNRRIKQLAETVDNSKERSNEEGIDFVVWKENDIGKSKVVFKNNTGSTTCLNKSQSSMKESMIPTKKSFVNVHLPRSHDDHIDNIEPATQNSEAGIRTTAITVDNQIPSTSRPMNFKKHKKNRRSKGKRKKSRTQTDNVKVDAVSERDLTVNRKDFGDEMVFCNKIYTTDVYPCDTSVDESVRFQVEDMIANIANKVCGNVSTVNAPHTKQVSPADTGKSDFLQLSSKERAKLLSRAIWSIYGEPLPPIPITTETLERVMAGISELRKYLGRAKYKPGRLLSLDPELWCIIESMRTEIKPDWL